jgi:hypothetical protein
LERFYLEQRRGLQEVMPKVGTTRAGRACTQQVEQFLDPYDFYYCHHGAHLKRKFDENAFDLRDLTENNDGAST